MSTEQWDTIILANLEWLEIVRLSQTFIIVCIINNQTEKYFNIQHVWIAIFRFYWAFPVNVIIQWLITSVTNYIPHSPPSLSFLDNYTFQLLLWIKNSFSLRFEKLKGKNWVQGSPCENHLCAKYYHMTTALNLL